ncbi:MAG: pyrimidine 5'-nucleotidase [Betaproteobacteria bacterium]|nr:pyrimidine 5'-nucleotidase [Betaproteobacteria bacterium]
MLQGSAWIFDLDNTLHDASVHVFPRINRAMTEYVQAHLKLSAADADALRHRYWQRYGATILGLIRHHDTNPAHFLRETHQFPDLHDVLLTEPLLRSTLARLPGRKFVFSNAPVHYAEDVLKGLGIIDLFADVYTIEHTRYRPKPDVYGFLRLCRSHHLHPRRCIMVEDKLENLQTAKRLGMKTVWVTGNLVARGRAPAYVDKTVRSLAKLPQLLKPIK